jgi:hypothetical protein
VLEAAPEGAWQPWDEIDANEDANDDDCARSGGGGDGVAGAWFAPQQRVKRAEAPGYEEA